MKCLLLYVIFFVIAVISTGYLMPKLDLKGWRNIFLLIWFFFCWNLPGILFGCNAHDSDDCYQASPRGGYERC